MFFVTVDGLLIASTANVLPCVLQSDCESSASRTVSLSSYICQQTQVGRSLDLPHLFEQGLELLMLAHSYKHVLIIDILLNERISVLSIDLDDNRLDGGVTLYQHPFVCSRHILEEAWQLECKCLC